MSYVIATPELMTSAAADLATIGANVNAAHLVAAAPTVAVLPAAADEVSASIAHLFSAHAASYQALAGQAAAFNGQFVQHLTAGAGVYADIEASLSQLLQNLPLPADVKLIVNFIATTPPQWLLFGFFGPLVGLITSPIWLPIAGLYVLYLLYLLSTGGINIMAPMCMGPGYFNINQCPFI